MERYSSLSTDVVPNHFGHTYEELLMRLLRGVYVETNVRTQAEISALPPVSFSIDLSSGQLPVCGIRKTFPKTAAAEVAWFFSGAQDVSFIKQYAPIWDKFVEDDGQTVAGAYGYRWRVHFGRDQLGLALDTLRADPTNRRVWISAWDPGLDGLGHPSKNVPCPIGFTLSICKGRLNSALFIRSSDVFVGLPYDVMGHALLMDACAASLDVELGEMHVTLAHPHLYGVHRIMAWDALQSAPSWSTIIMPKVTMEGITSHPHEYVAMMAEKSKEIVQPDFMCRPELII